MKVMYRRRDGWETTGDTDAWTVLHSHKAVHKDGTRSIETYYQTPAGTRIAVLLHDDKAITRRLELDIAICTCAGTHHTWY